MCWYTDFLLVFSIKYDFKYLLSTYYSLKINCGLGVHWHSPDFTLIKHDKNMSEWLIHYKVSTTLWWTPLKPPFICMILMTDIRK
jgi:hypothetical protein